MFWAPGYGLGSQVCISGPSSRSRKSGPAETPGAPLEREWNCRHLPLRHFGSGLQAINLLVDDF
ncbi:protein of unknown function [Candidatus Hydrogenisulfobacillus filiaventi]|uniref:Uncharacterized protein n=1 Tax=Candidatus Hydrogenisulfobacillus filiaventi TaxID=2707344 RepID=A0A6F8ZFV9_9FIRM|nr:protein of unknown function [Candidatus Hydrogenisulfobacillus filiaventi]